MGDNISVKLTADIAELQAKFAVARAESTALNNELNKLARDANKTGMTAPLQSEIMRVSEALVTAKASTAAFETELKAAQAVSSGMHGSISAITRETRALFDELSAGRIRMVPGTLAQIANLGFGIQGGMLAALGGAALFAGGLGYLAYATIASNKELERLAEGFAMTGRGAQVSVEFLAQWHQLDLGIFDSAAKATNSILAMEAADGRLNARLINSVNQLMPQFIRQFGEEAPQEVQKLLHSLEDLTVDGFQKLDREQLNLSIAQYETIRNLIETGRQAEAADQIIQALAEHGTGHINSLEESLAKAKETAAAMKKEIDAAAGSFMAAGRAGSLYRAELEKIAGLQQAIANQGPAEAVARAKDELDWADKQNIKLGERQKIVKDLERAWKDYQTAFAGGSQPTQDKFMSAYIAIQQKLAEFDKKKNEERYRDFVAKEQSEVEAGGAGSALRIAALQKEADFAKATFGEQSIQYRLKMAEIVAQRRQAGDKNAHAATEEARKEAQAAREAARQQQEIQNSSLATSQHLDEINLSTKKATLDREVALHQITADQEGAQLKQLASDQALAEVGTLRTLQTNLDASSVEWQKYEAEIEIILAKLRKYKADIDLGLVTSSDKEIKQEVSLRKRGIAEMTAAENTFVSSIMSGRVTLYGALSQAGLQFVQKEVENDLRGMTERLMYSKAELAADKSLGQLGVVWEWLFQTQRTGAAVVGAETRAAAEATAQGKSAAVSMAMGSTQIENDAMKAASGAYQAVVGIPIVGPVLAPIAAGIAFGAVMAFDNLSSFDVGTNYVPNDMIAKVHQGERIIPASDNDAMIRAMSGGGGGGVHLHYAPNIQGVPMPDMKSILRNGGNDLLQYLGRMARNGTLQNYIGGR